MADVTVETKKPPKPQKPDTLKRPIRRRVKRYGKRLTRWVSRYQARQSLVPNAPFLENALFPFLSEFEDRWHQMEAEAREIVMTTAAGRDGRTFAS